jgi:manganese/zinc/iron transport system permease protein
VAVAVALLVALLWRPLKLLCFDADYAAALGFPARRLELLLNMAVAAAAVAAFEAVGSILVVAMLVCPAAAMRLMTDDYRTQVLGSAVLGGVLGIAGYLLAGPVPAALGGTVALNAAGVIGTLGGVAVAAAALLRTLRRGAPREAVAAPGA